jgi:hypothetical protein
MVRLATGQAHPRALLVHSRQLRHRRLAAVEDDAGVGEAGDSEDPQDLVRAAVEDEAAAFGFQLPPHLEEEGDPGRVDELALREADEDGVVAARNPLQRRLQALDAPEVELTLELQLAPASAEIALGDLQDLSPAIVVSSTRKRRPSYRRGAR